MIAHGGAGPTWRATDTVTGVQVALKLFDRPGDAATEAARLQSAKAAPGVARLADHDSGWTATEWIDGQTLSSRLAAGSLPNDEALELISQLARSLDALHGLGLVHGDMSPSNVLIDDEQRTTIIDLGPSPVEPTQPDRTSRHEIVTTPRYTAPEVAGGAPAGEAADRYALAIMSYEMLAGATPFPDGAHPMAMLSHHLSSQPQPISEHAPRFGSAMDTVFDRALAKDPTDRFATGADLVQAIRQALDEPSSAGPGIDRRAWIAVGVVVAALLALGFLVTSQRSEPSAVASNEPSAVASSEPAAIASSEPAAIASSESAADQEQAVTLVHGPIMRAELSQPWPAGTAAGRVCNVVASPGYEDGVLASNWYQGSDDNSFALVPGAGVDGSTALRVGEASLFGLVGERLAIEGGINHVFSAWVRHQGEPSRSGMWIEFEDADNVHLEQYDEAYFTPDQVAGDEPQRFEVVVRVPDEAAWAIPTFFKNGSDGALLVDEVVFGPASTCGDVPS